jgi:hypothetical protein
MEEQPNFYDSQRRKNAKMAHGGFIYNIVKNFEDHALFYCEERKKDLKCQASANFYFEESRLKISKSKHNHEPELKRIEVQKFKVFSEKI